jgi:hypothetical protein
MRHFVFVIALAGCQPSSQSPADAGADLGDEAAGDMTMAPSDMGTSAGGDFGLAPDPNGKKGQIALTSGSYMLASTSMTIGSAGASFQTISGATSPTCPPPSTFGSCIVVGNCAGTVMAGTTTFSSAGQITISGGTPTVMLTPDGTSKYTPFSQATALWTGATTFTVSAAGDVVPAFSTTLTAPAQPDFTAPTFPTSGSIAIDRSTDFQVTWTGGGGGIVLAQLQTNTPQAEFVRCTYDGAANGGTIPTAALQLVQAGATGNLAVAVTNSVDVTAGDWTVTVTATTPPTQAGRYLSSGASVTFQ